MVVRKGDKDIGAIGLMDTPREAAKIALKRLREMGITRMIMISGDHQKVADAIAKDVGLDEAWGDLMPEDKVASIKKFAGEDKVAMVGDGVNDAPAMASATVGKRESEKTCSLEIGMKSCGAVGMYERGGTVLRVGGTGWANG